MGKGETAQGRGIGEIGDLGLLRVVVDTRQQGQAFQMPDPAWAQGREDAGQLPVSPKSLEQIAQLSDVTLNLSDGHYLKLGLALQLAPKATVTDYTSGGAAAKALDLAINDLGTDNYNELLQPSFRAQAKVQLQQQIVAAYQGQVLGIYFTDFIMQ